ncbi:hypothetical protein KFE98_04075 [bacterium SCSIO 12741]|nr:hypothetical protein KFE98_04075 [bacterium SCSIO 12741]
MTIVLTIHILLTLFMTGLCWFVQIVHYPLFLQIRQEDFAEYEQRNFATGYITVPVMIVEWITGFWMLWETPDVWWMINGALMIAIGLSTFLFQVPTHLRLAASPNPQLIRFLIRTNWIRTASWTLRSILLAIWLIHSLG